MNKKEKAKKTVEILKEMYPDAVCSLGYESPLQLLIAVRLSAQCTDARVNQVTPALFERYKTLDDFASADVADIEKYIYSCGFYKSKAKSIVEAANKIKNDFGGRVPDTIEELVTIPGVGRKTANLIVGDIYGKSAMVVDTHCIRITNRLGLAAEKDPVKLEMQLRKIIPAKDGSDFCHRIVLFGRDVCTARSPRCGECPLGGFCAKAGVKEKQAK
ncbi:MAG: endonuclease III [Clostridiales bacterium]|nr:endonuclease III [Clostridiales bacterium]